MSTTSEFWASFGASTLNSLLDKTIEIRKNNSVTEIQALKDTIAEMKARLDVISNEKVMLIRQVARLELLNEQLTDRLKLATPSSDREVL